MKRLWIMAVLLPQFAWGQVFTSVSVENVKGSEPGDVRVAGISRDGRYALVTSMSNKGLERVTLDDGTRVRLTDNEGAGLSPVMSEDGLLVMHCSDICGEDHLLRTAVDVTDVATGKSLRVMEPNRDLVSFHFAGTQAVVENGENTIRHKVGTKQTVGEERPTISCYDLKLQLTRNGQTVTLTPNGDDEETRYIWASISPDGTRILYHVSTEGTYVCDLNGENVQFVAFDCLAPQWYDDHTIVGMKEQDDDLFITSCAIVVYTLDGARQQLTSDDEVLLYPYCSAESGRIVCTRQNGQMVILNVRK
ncbi:MAG: hypothetical protein ACI4B5_07545 [Bacteroidaceae bacterium]